MKFDWKSAKKDLAKGFKEFKLRYFNYFSLALLAGFILFYITFKIFPNTPVTYKVPIMWAVFVTFLLFCIFNHWTHKDWKAHFFFDIFYILIIFIMALTYTAVAVKEPITAFHLIITFIFVGYGGLALQTAFIHFDSLKKNNILFVVFSYIFFVFALIFFFSTLFALLQTDTSKLVFSETNSSVTRLEDFLYFSASNFYSSTYGDILPLGDRMRLIALIQLLCSSLVHVIVISRLVPKK